MSSTPTQRFGTLAVHAGQSPEATTGAIMPPIFQTSTYVQPAIAEPLGGIYDYARVANPTREALERNLAALEGGAHGIAFASGLAAIESVLKRLSAGDHIVSEENTYGGTTRMFTRVLSKLGLEFTFVDSRDSDAVADAMTPRTRLVHVETPTNPMMRLCDIARVAEVAHAGGALLMVDNTFASPYNQRPLELGADVAVHSTTKYLNGHSDIIGGVVVVDDEDLAEEIRFVRKSSGAVPGPMDAWLCLRGTKTLHLRMGAHNSNGLAVARFLQEHPRVDRVFYPGLPSHEQHELATRQMTGFTGMVSVDVGTLERARALVEHTQLFQLAESLGGVESLVSVPSLMTHASVPREMRERMGVTDGLVRLSVGIEDIDDLLADLDGALQG
ncbi:MAG: PLP-dependent transferase [Gemmatimonadales bacterium]|jgi:cystathionine beta-lyase/cystathionine gamma-synthase|nr:MAG: PLP-dependent transferase [Gemmatimonadales bacterium]